MKKDENFMSAEKFKQIREDLNKSQPYIAQAIEVSTRQVANYEAGITAVPRKFAQKMQYFKEQGFDSEKKTKTYKIELLDLQVSAGAGHNQEIVETKRFLEVDAGLFKVVQLPERLRACVVVGDSMEPRLFANDTAIYEIGGYTGAGIYVLRVDKEYYIKRLEKTLAGEIRVISYNKDYTPYILPLDAAQSAILGRFILAITVG